MPECANLNLIFSLKKTRRWKWLAYVLMGKVLLITAGYIIFIYKFKEILKAVIEKESQGQYTFNASGVKLSLWNQQITLNNVKVKPLNPAQASADTRHHSYNHSRLRVLDGHSPAGR